MFTIPCRRRRHGVAGCPVWLCIKLWQTAWGCSAERTVCLPKSAEG